MDLASATNQPIEVKTTSGRTLVVNRGTLRTVSELQDWVNHQPQPQRARIQNLAELPRQLAAIVLQQEAATRNEWPPEVAMPEGWRALYTLPGGTARLLMAALKKAQPNITEQEADALMDDLTYQQFQRIGIFFLQGIDIESPLVLAAVGQETNGDSLPNRITVQMEETAAENQPTGPS
jgi:hypothetical protein